MDNQIADISLEDIKCLMKPFGIDVNLNEFVPARHFELVSNNYYIGYIPENPKNSNDHRYASSFSFEGFVKIIFNSTKFLFYSLKDKSTTSVCNPYYSCRSLEEAMIKKDLM